MITLPLARQRGLLSCRRAEEQRTWRESEARRPEALYKNSNLFGLPPRLSLGPSFNCSDTEHSATKLRSLIAYSIIIPKTYTILTHFFSFTVYLSATFYFFVTSLCFEMSLEGYFWFSLQFLIAVSSLPSLIPVRFNRYLRNLAPRRPRSLGGRFYFE